MRKVLEGTSFFYRRVRGTFLARTVLAVLYVELSMHARSWRYCTWNFPCTVVVQKIHSQHSQHMTSNSSPVPHRLVEAVRNQLLQLPGVDTEMVQIAVRAMLDNPHNATGAKLRYMVLLARKHPSNFIDACRKGCPDSLLMRHNLPPAPRKPAHTTITTNIFSTLACSACGMRRCISEPANATRMGSMKGGGVVVICHEPSCSRHMMTTAPKF